MIRDLFLGDSYYRTFVVYAVSCSALTVCYLLWYFLSHPEVRQDCRKVWVRLGNFRKLGLVPPPTSGPEHKEAPAVQPLLGRNYRGILTHG